MRPRHLSLALASALLLAVPGCGEEEPAALLSQSRADTLLGILDDAEQQFEEGACDELEGDTLPALEQAVAEVSSDVEESFRAALDEETQALAELAKDCKPQEEETTTAPPTTAPTTTEVAPPTTTQTEPETVTEEQTVEEEPPPEGAEGEGNSSESDSGSDSGSGSNGAIEPPGKSGDAPPESAGGSGSGGGSPAGSGGGGPEGGE